jgi:predicted DNA-binding transcriptional regulator AlpA
MMVKAYHLARQVMNSLISHPIQLLTLHRNNCTLAASEHSRNYYFTYAATMIDISDFVTLSEAARAAGISRRTLQYHMRDRTAPEYTRIGREVVFCRGEVIAWAGIHYPEGKPRRGRKMHGSQRQKT